MRKLKEEQWDAWEKGHKTEHQVKLEKALTGIRPETGDPLTALRGRKTSKLSLVLPITRVPNQTYTIK